MLSFLNDYSEGACTEIMREMIRTNWEDTSGYTTDPYSEEARNRIKEAIGKVGKNDVDVHFVVGGTQANLTIISYLLKPYEAVIACDSGHINVHETGAIEASGHKVIPTKGKDGKIQISEIEHVLKTHLNEHMVRPRMVYISNSTEIGTIYTKQELEELSDYCYEKNLILFMDGARLGAALTAKENDLTLNDIAKLVDVFYIGGTKNGALFGEAIVFPNPQVSTYFRYQIKQRGGMLAKGRLLGIQFNELFKDNLYFKLAAHANELAQKLQAGMRGLGIEFFIDSPTNQIFPIISKDLKTKLENSIAFELWEELDEDRVVVRFVTSWASTEKEVSDCLDIIKNSLSE